MQSGIYDSFLGKMSVSMNFQVFTSSYLNNENDKYLQILGLLEVNIKLIKWMIMSFIQL